MKETSVEGEAAVVSAKAVINKILEKEESTIEKIVIRWSDQAETAKKEPESVEIASTENIEMEGESPEVESGDKSGGSSDEEAKEKKTIRANTSHHYLLHTIAESEDDREYVTSGYLIDSVSDYSENSIRPSLKELHNRRLVERDTVEGSGNEYSYTLSEWGEETLSKLGEPE